MFGKKCEKTTKQKLITVYDYSIETTIMGKNGEEVTILSSESAGKKDEAAIQASHNIYSKQGWFYRNGQNEFLSVDYYKVSKITVTEIDSRQVLVDV
jgi:hypothetical protein